MHGKDAVVEEILDWRPYDYTTDLTILDTPAGHVKFPHTMEFEPTATGTTIHMRFAMPKTKREQKVAPAIGEAYGQALRSVMPELVAQLDAEMAARAEGRDPEPELAAPKPDGVLAGIQPLVIVG